MLLRLFFDAGSGVLLWANDAEAKARFGYPVESGMLDVAPELRAEAQAGVERAVAVAAARELGLLHAEMGEQAPALIQRA